MDKKKIKDVKQKSDRRIQCSENRTLPDSDISDYISDFLDNANSSASLSENSCDKYTHNNFNNMFNKIKHHMQLYLGQRYILFDRDFS